MISADLEAKVIAALAKRFNDDEIGLAFQIIGAWAVTPGKVKSMQNGKAIALLSVSLSLPETVTYTTPATAFNGSIELSVRFELDHTGIALQLFGNSIAELFKAWQAETYQQSFEALDLPEFSVDEVSLGRSEPPMLNRADGLVTVKIPFALSGSYRETPPTPPPTEQP